MLNGTEIYVKSLYKAVFQTFIKKILFKKSNCILQASFNFPIAVLTFIMSKILQKFDLFQII